MSARRLTALLWAINLSAISASMFVYLAQHAYHALGNLLGFVLLGACFQGFYNLSRVALPAHHLGLPGTFHVGVLQITASLAAVSGALGYFAGQALLRRLARRVATPSVHPTVP